MKYEWKKQDKGLYLPKKEPETVMVPPMKFIMLNGKGDPNQPAFAETVGALYALSYAIKMLPKKGVTPSGYYDYTIFPLEGEWDLADEAKNLCFLDKENLLYTLMIRQPDFVTESVFQTALEIAGRKNSHPLLEMIRFETLKGGLNLHILHLGSFDNEPASFKKMDDYCTAHHLRRTIPTHREIYLSDARKTAPEKLRTVLRYQVAKI